VHLPQTLLANCLFCIVLIARDSYILLKNFMMMVMPCLTNKHTEPTYTDAQLAHRRSQDFLYGCALYSPPPKVDDLFLFIFIFIFLVVALKAQAKTTKLTTPTVRISTISSKNGLLLSPGMRGLPGSSLTTFPCKFGAQIFFSIPGVHVHPLLRLCDWHLGDLSPRVSNKCFG